MKRDKMMMLTSFLAETGNGTCATKWLRLAICGVALLTTMAVASTASAWSYTLAAPVTIDGTNDGGTGVRGTINMVTGHFDLPTPTGNDVGTVDSNTDMTAQDFVWFSITLDSGSAPVDQIRASIVPIAFTAEYYDLSFTNNNPMGAGFSTAGGGVAPNDNGGANPNAPVAIDQGFGAFSEYNWVYGEAGSLGSPNANQLNENDTSAELLWVGEMLVSGGQGVIYNNVINFMIHSPGQSSFTVSGVVPEPSTGLLLSGGLIGMAIKRRREARGRA
ncbi:MAG: PEP-CTERM sorting domain-containing protein [bacterium]|nr:PEP-CTERM sorting domain-containing protein [bacterium]